MLLSEWCWVTRSPLGGNYSLTFYILYLFHPSLVYFELLALFWCYCHSVLTFIITVFFTPDCSEHTYTLSATWLFSHCFQFLLLHDTDKVIFFIVSYFCFPCLLLSQSLCVSLCIISKSKHCLCLQLCTSRAKNAFHVLTDVYPFLAYWTRLMPRVWDYSLCNRGS